MTRSRPGRTGAPGALRERRVPMDAGILPPEGCGPASSPIPASEIRAFPGMYPRKRRRGVKFAKKSLKPWNNAVPVG